MIRRFLPSLVLIAACGTVTAQDPDASSPPDASGAPDAGAPQPGQALLQAETPSQDFGTVTVGRQSAQAVLAIRNAGAERSGALAVEVVGGASASFALTDACTGATLEPAGRCELRAHFTPTAAGAQTATLRVRATPGGEAAIVLVGNALAPGALAVDVEALSFGALDLGDGAPAQTLTVRNTGGEPSAPLAVAIADRTSFEAIGDRCSGTSLAPGATCTITIAFLPDTVGSKATSITISGGPAGAVAASLGGTGTARITVAIAGETHGRVRSTPPGIDCGATCSASFATSPVILSATAEGGAQFSGWADACRSSGADCTVALDGAKNVGARFTFGLQIGFSNLHQAAGGRVVAPAAGVDCGASCEARVTVGEIVELQGQSDGDSVFLSWQRGCSGTGRCSVAMTQDRSVEAVFAPSQLPLRVSVGNGWCGRVVSTPPGMDCQDPGTGCVASFPYGTQVDLRFEGASSCSEHWDSGCLPGTGCRVVMTEPRTVQAHLNP